MPTVSEPREPERTERIKQCVREFIEAKCDRFGSYGFANTPEILHARLYGLGMRGEDLSTEVRLAERERSERNRELR